MHRLTRRYALTVMTLTAMILTATVSGCNSSDEQVLQQSLTRLAAKNDQMARHTQQIAEATRQLIESDAQARSKLVELQQHLQDGVQTERQSLDRQHAELETERQDIARQRQRDPLIAAAIVNLGVLLASLAPLLLAYWVLRNSWVQESNCVDELLIQELVSESPLFLPKPRLALPTAESPADPAGACASVTPTSGAKA